MGCSLVFISSLYDMEATGKVTQRNTDATPVALLHSTVHQQFFTAIFFWCPSAQQVDISCK